MASGPVEIDPRLFRDTLGHYPTGVTVITGISSTGVPVGMVVGSFTSVSLDPPLVAFLPRTDSATFAELRECATFCVNVLASDQEGLCRQFAVSGGDKFAGVDWSPGLKGAPILDGVVAWIECDWQEISPAGDHFVVMGRVLDLGIRRPALPLLFFQGGYGRFSLPSLTTADPHLIQAAMLAERIRGHVERCSAELGVECAVLAKIDEEIVTVLTANGRATGDRPSVGDRVPHIAPLGSVFVADAPGPEMDRWLRHLAGSPEGTLERLRANVHRVREVGYSLTLSADTCETPRALSAEYSSPHATPTLARQLREVIAHSIDRYEPQLARDGVHDLESIAVLVDTPPDAPLLAIRILDLPQGVDASVVESWIEVLSGTAAAAARRLRHP